MSTVHIPLLTRSKILKSEIIPLMYAMQVNPFPPLYIVRKNHVINTITTLEKYLLIVKNCFTSGCMSRFIGIRFRSWFVVYS